jgi:hypothetical protein
MKLTKLFALAVIPAMLIACGTDDTETDDTWTDPGLTEQPAAERDAREETVGLNEIGDSGVGGEVEIRESGDQAHVATRIEDGGPNVSYNGGIYRGTCEAPGERVAQLEPVQTQADGTGQAMSMVQIPGWGTTRTPGPETTPGQTAQGLVIAYYRGDAGQGTPVVCGELRDAR